MYIPPHTPTLLTLTATLLLIQSTTSLPATSPLPGHPIYALPPLDPLVPPLLNGSSSNGNCASKSKYPSWTSADWVVEDCYRVVQQLYVKEVYAHPKVVYEFLAQGLSPRQYPLAQRTPRKYIFRKWIDILGGLGRRERERCDFTFKAGGEGGKMAAKERERADAPLHPGSCVLTIMMLDWFQPGNLPAGTGYNRADTDLSTYQDIYDAARSIETACTVSKSPGWLMTGESFLVHDLP